MTDRQDYLNKLIDYKTYYSRIAHHYNYEELEQLVSEWLGTKFDSVGKELKKSVKDDSLLNNISGWVDLVPMVNAQRMSQAFSKAGGIMARGEVVCVLKEVARGIAK
tara:strand:+ start:579 stop:899 length:321 start_codon:yes stop_codon:yes gene_type:complete